MVTNWPTSAGFASKGVRKRKRSGRKGNKAQQAARIDARDKRQLPERAEYAVKVFAWADHERRVEVMEYYDRLTGECKQPVHVTDPIPKQPPGAGGPGTPGNYPTRNILTF